MAEPRTSQDLFNRVADIIDFSPHKYNQGVWGGAGTKYVGIDPSYIEWDDISWDIDDVGIDEEELTQKEEERVDDACGTQACVAGWACLLSGFHPTMIEMDLNADTDDRAGSIINRVSSMFTDLQRELRKGGLVNLFSKKIGFNYNVMSDKPGIDLPINPETNRVLQMDDIESEKGVRIGGNTFYRPDMQGRVLLDLDHNEASTLFDGDYVWEAEDLRLIGKGEQIHEILNEKWNDEEEWCHACDEERIHCEC
jgi:hypothetical protein